MMNDNDLRGLVLQKYYQKRREGWIQWKSEDFQDVEADFAAADLFSVCDQLGQHGLIDWKCVEDNSGAILDGRGKITAFGIDVVEKKQASPISVNFDYSDHSIAISSSSNVQIGSGNIQGLSIHVQKLWDAIEAAAAPLEKKEEAKTALRKFLEHPAVTAVLGGLASAIRG
jgi:hypothetical protein